MPDAEIRFFAALQKVVGPQHLKAKSLGRKVSRYDVFLDSDYTLYHLKGRVKDVVARILEGLMSTGRVPSGILSHYVDGMFIDHPDHGTRIIEFDEEQHFNTFRRVTLDCLATISNAPYIRSYAEYCLNARFFNAMLRKHRLRLQVQAVPTDAAAFQKLVETYAVGNSRYIEPKAGFDYWGGRIAQRAYYDSLRDIAHLADQNSGFRPAIRFAKWEFEITCGKPFEKIDSTDLAGLIQTRLSQQN